LPRKGARIQAAFALGAEDIPLELWVIDVDSGRRRRLLRFRPTRTFSEQILPFFDHAHPLAGRIYDFVRAEDIAVAVHYVVSQPRRCDVASLRIEPRLQG